MDYWSALAELGLEEDGLTRDRVRRTYLRRLREHPPEKDPDGFRRLRQAFERLREAFPDEEEPVKQEPLVRVEVAPAPVAEVAVVAPPMEIVLPLPLPRVVLPPPDFQPLSPVLTEIATLIFTGNIAGARALEERWREQHDDHRQWRSEAVLRWELLRELLGVAEDLPQPIVKILAITLRDDLELSHARPALDDYRLANEKLAGEASSLLFMRANNIFKQIEGTLWIPRRIELPFLSQTNRILEETRQRIASNLSRPRPQSKSGAAVVFPALMVLALLVRLMSGSSPPSYAPPLYKPIEIPKFQMINLPKEAFFIPPPMPRLVYRDDGPMQLQQQIVESAAVLQKYEISSEAQEQAAAALQTAALAHNCRAMRLAMEQLQAGPPSEIELRRLYANMHVEALKQRVELVCPPRKKR